MQSAALMGLGGLNVLIERPQTDHQVKYNLGLVQTLSKHLEIQMRLRSEGEREQVRENHCTERFTGFFLVVFSFAVVMLASAMLPVFLQGFFTIQSALRDAMICATAVLLGLIWLANNIVKKDGVQGLNRAIRGQ